MNVEDQLLSEIAAHPDCPALRDALADWLSAQGRLGEALEWRAWAATLRRPLTASQRLANRRLRPTHSEGPQPQAEQHQR
jgi:hypothetical protein